jgi:glycosyltransferase involved in cell wall biosynthesis
MKICLIGPGEIEIPPNGWGALETVVWNQYVQLSKNSKYDVKVVNNPDPNQIYQEIEKFRPDIVHLHYGKHYEILPFINCRKIITNHDGSFINSWQFHENIIRQFMYDCEFFILTSWEKELLTNIGLPKYHIHILPNGVDFNAFTKIDKPQNNKSICLGKIDARKNQSFLQKLDIDVVFVGQNSDANFNPLDSNYLGLWNREQVYSNLTEYVNLILLSNAELQPLVCLEALSAGLGLVISEQSSQNLDCNLDFITVIPDHKMKDSQYIKDAILENRKTCLSIDRSLIYNYARSFDWSNIIKNYESLI